MNSIDEAFSAIERKDFLPPGLHDQASVDRPLPIGYGQTNSQPTTVRHMLEWLRPEPGQKILDVGSGSGWTTGLLAHLVGPDGFVYAVERIPSLVTFGRDNCARAGVENVQFFTAEPHIYGLPEHAPYDRILVSAGADEVPPELIEQLQTGGKLVIPIKSDVLEITKVSGTDTETIAHHGYTFVPLT